jgi:hypothetical protein
MNEELSIVADALPRINRRQRPGEGVGTLQSGLGLSL